MAVRGRYCGSIGDRVDGGVASSTAVLLLDAVWPTCSRPSLPCTTVQSGRSPELCAARGEPNREWWTVHGRRTPVGGEVSRHPEGGERLKIHRIPPSLQSVGIEAVTSSLEQLLATQGSMDPTAMLAATQALADLSPSSVSDASASDGSIGTTFADMLANVQAARAGTAGTGGASVTGATAATAGGSAIGGAAVTGATAGGSAISGAAVTGGAPLTGGASVISAPSATGESETGETSAVGESEANEATGAGESETNETSAAGESETNEASATAGPLAASGTTAARGALVTGGASATTFAPFVPHGGRYGFFPTATTNYTNGKESEIARRLDALGNALHLHIVGLSGYRTPQHSVAVGGYANDPHTRGEAMDAPGVEGVPESKLRQFGLTRPFPGASEADHIQLA